MRSRGHLRAALTRADFRRLYTVRLAGQFGDGVFQAALAATVLFNPDRQARAADVAAGFAVVLLPYSFVGPFAGVLLDRWWRQRVLVVSNLARSAALVGVAAEIAGGVHGEPFFASALVVFSVNRFFLAALSASLPHTVSPAELVTANSLSTTSGSLVTTLGATAAIGVRSLVGATDGAYAAIALAATIPYLLSAFAAGGFRRELLGPDEVERSRRETARDVIAGMLAGARHVASRKPALHALGAIGVFRFCYGVSTICTLLLYRNYFQDEGFFRAGLAGLGQAVAMVAAGAAVAALVTPAATRRLGFVGWPTVLLATAGVVEVALGLPYRMPLLLLAAAGLGFTAQGMKICVDTLVQQQVDDEFRGRVFSLYDTMFNVTFVAAAVATALVLPDSGYSPAAVVVLGAVYALTAVVYARVAGGPRRRTPVPAATPAGSA